MYAYMDGWTDACMHECMYVCIDGWMQECMYAWMDGCMDAIHNMYVLRYTYVYMFQ